MVVKQGGRLPTRGLLSRIRTIAAVILPAILLLPAGATASEQPVVHHRQINRQPVADGVHLIRIRQFDSLGWLNISALETDHTRPHLYFDAVSAHDTVTGAEPLSRTAQKRGAVAAVNGDFFHIRSSKAPLGTHLQSGELFKSPDAGRELAVGFFHSETGSTPVIGPISFRGQIATADGSEHELDGWNEPVLGEDGLNYYNSRWGPAAPGTDSAYLSDFSDLVHVLLDKNQRVVDVLEGHAGPVIPEGGGVVLGHGKGGSWLLTTAHPGHTFKISHTIEPSGLAAAVGGSPQLLGDGEILPAPGGAVHPRTAFGVDESRTRSWLVVVEGRSSLSRGLSLHELGALMKDFGAHDAINLDGGGSSTLLARVPGAGQARVQNQFSDATERSVPNGIAIFSSAPSGDAANLFIEPPAQRSPFLIEPEALRLPPGESYTPVVFATDENINPINLPKSLSWTVTPPDLGSFSPDGVFTAARPGRGRITASASTGTSTLEASLPLRVIDEPVRLEILPAALSLSAGQEVALAVHAVDSRGYAAPLTMEQVKWEVRGKVGTIRDGRFVAATEPDSGELEVHFGGLRGLAPVAIGSRPVLLASFDQEGMWNSRGFPGEVQHELSLLDHLPFIRERERATKLKYDFSGTDRIRAAYLRPEGGKLQVPGRPLKLGLWVFGDGRKAWLRGKLTDAEETSLTVDFARHIDWTGWRYVEAEIPPGTSYPVFMNSIYIVETRQDAHYSGSILFDELFAVHGAELQASPATAEEEPAPANRPEVLDRIDDENYRFIVFVGNRQAKKEPDAAGTRVMGALAREIEKQEAEFVVFTGTLPGNEPALFDQLQKPLYRIATPSATENEEVRKRYGDSYYRFARGESEFVFLNTAQPGLRLSNEKQWLWLRERLDDADRGNLFLFSHTPVIGFSPGDTSGWADRSEATLFQHLLAGEVNEGRNVYVIDGYGITNRALDGVQYLSSTEAGNEKAFNCLVVTVKNGDVTYQATSLIP